MYIDTQTLFLTISFGYAHCQQQHVHRIIAEALKKTPLPENDRTKQDIRFGNALKHAGLSITLTSLASIIAFSVGSTVDIPAIKSFCLFASFCFLGNYS